ncbi:unnamed protein product [marine sediment metagenome]|uniref:Uncharacterized protein n=1 Tax=marine sediment metagenome TaxID=412755 RepID=X1EJX9_9ZZZZ
MEEFLPDINANQLNDFQSQQAMKYVGIKGFIYKILDNWI